MKFSFPSFTDIENLNEREDGLIYVKYSRYPFSGFAFSTKSVICNLHSLITYGEGVESALIFEGLPYSTKFNELQIYEEGRLIAWTNFYENEDGDYPNCPFDHEGVQEIKEEEDYLYSTYFLDDGLYGWRLAKDFSGIKIFLRFPSLEEIKLYNFKKECLDYYLEKENTFFLNTLKREELTKNNQLKKFVYYSLFSEVKQDVKNKMTLFFLDADLWWEKPDLRDKYFVHGRYIECKCVSSDHCFVNNKLFFTKDFKLEGTSMEYMKDFVKFFGVKNIGVRGQLTQSLIDTWFWDCDVIGWRGWFKSLQLENLDSSGQADLYFF